MRERDPSPRRRFGSLTETSLSFPSSLRSVPVIVTILTVALSTFFAVALGFSATSTATLKDYTGLIMDNTGIDIRRL